MIFIEHTDRIADLWSAGLTGSESGYIFVPAMLPRSYMPTPGILPRKHGQYKNPETRTEITLVVNERLARLHPLGSTYTR